MAKALIVVDVQNDFALPTGALSVPRGEEVAQRIAHYIDANQGSYDYLISTQDWHLAPGEHFEEWPEHCKAYTLGARLHEALKGVHFDFEVRKGHYSAAYSGFDGFGINGWTLRSYLRAKDVDAVDIVGLAYDFCVKETAIQAAREGFTVRVLRPYTGEITPEGGNAATAEMTQAGVQIVLDPPQVPHFTELVELIKAQATADRGRDIALSNGSTTRTYLDMKNVLANTTALRLAAKAMVEWLDYFDAPHSAFGGPGLGAYVISVAVAYERDNARWFNIRDNVKDHGMGKRIEGAELTKGDRVVITDDVANSGTSLVEAVEHVRATGATVVAVMPIVDRAGVAKDRITELGIPYLPLITHEDLGLPAMAQVS